LVLGGVLLGPISAGAVADAPPEPQPYQLPTMMGDGADFHERPPALVEPPAIDAEAVFTRVVACFPAESKFKIDVNLKGMLASSDMATIEENTSYLGKSYVGLIANMPLYSSAELDRAKDRERTRRESVASSVSQLVAGVSARNQAMREMGLYRTLEARSAVRVKSGIVEITEQVGYLKDLSAAAEKIIVQDAKILEARLKLVGGCDPERAEPISKWLAEIVAVPK
jgi:hypothetical protein